MVSDVVDEERPDTAGDGTMASTRRVWFRCAGGLSDDPGIHLVVGAYLSDVTGN